MSKTKTNPSLEGGVSRAVDFIERPHMGKSKQYVCDPVGPGIGQCKLQACDTPTAALEQALWFLLDKVQPIPISFNSEKEYDESSR